MPTPKIRRRKTKSERIAQGNLLLVLALVGIVMCSIRFRDTIATTLRRHTRSIAQPCHEKELPPMTDSSYATVMGFATGYDIQDYKRFVGSLRNTGYKGNILLAVAPDINEESMAYLSSRRVDVSKVEFIPCTHSIFDDDPGEDHKDDMDSHEKEARSCVAPYSDLKARWGRFPFLRDRLQACKSCAGPVLITDVRDTFFQRDPFASGHPQVQGLQVFEEHVKQTTKHWLVEWPVKTCKGVVYDEIMLCSGTAIGTREAMIDYLDIMEKEMNVWMNDKKCHFKLSGDDQAIHNYLYYSGQLPFAKAIPNRMGIVHTVGYIASVIREKHRDRMEAKNMSESEPYDGTTPGTKPWITQEYDLTDEEGYILDFDGKKSAVVHQYDRFGVPIDLWLEQASGLVDK